MDQLKFRGVFQYIASSLADAFEGYTELARVIRAGELSFKCVNEFCEGRQGLQEGVFANKPGFCYS